MVVVGQSVTLLVPELVEGSNSDTESHGEEEGAAESALCSSDSDTNSSGSEGEFSESDGKLIF